MASYVSGFPRVPSQRAGRSEPGWERRSLRYLSRDLAVEGPKATTLALRVLSGGRGRLRP
jgi:hypothetical protein